MIKILFVFLFNLLPIFLFASEGVEICGEIVNSRGENIVKAGGVIRVVPTSLTQPIAKDGTFTLVLPADYSDDEYIEIEVKNVEGYKNYKKPVKITKVNNLTCKYQIKIVLEKEESYIVKAKINLDNCINKFAYKLEVRNPINNEVMISKELEDSEIKEVITNQENLKEVEIRIIPLNSSLFEIFTKNVYIVDNYANVGNIDIKLKDDIQDVREEIYSLDKEIRLILNKSVMEIDFKIMQKLYRDFVMLTEIAIEIERNRETEYIAIKNSLTDYLYRKNDSISKELDRCYINYKESNYNGNIKMFSLDVINKDDKVKQLFIKTYYSFKILKEVLPCSEFRGHSIYYHYEKMCAIYSNIYLKLLNKIDK